MDATWKDVSIVERKHCVRMVLREGNRGIFANIAKETKQKGMKGKNTLHLLGMLQAYYTLKDVDSEGLREF